MGTQLSASGCVLEISTFNTLQSHTPTPKLGESALGCLNCCHLLFLGWWHVAMAPEVPQDLPGGTWVPGQRCALPMNVNRSMVWVCA